MEYVPTDSIVIRGAREHNLKDVSLALPRDRLIVFTGLSGSGKSSLAFDTIYAEGQRRYVESLSAYARQFLGQMDKPDVDVIEGLSPAISIDQKGTSRNPRSTVGTVTEIHDYLRLLFARVGVPHCPVCGREIHRQTVDQMADRVEQLGEGSRLLVLGPAVRGRKGEYHQLLQEIRKQGFNRVRVDGEMYLLDEDPEIPMERYKQHDIDVVVDRLVLGPEQRTRLVDSLETASKLGQGTVLIVDATGEREDLLMSQAYACPYDGTQVAEPEPRNFSFNSPYGACPTCTGLGHAAGRRPRPPDPGPGAQPARGGDRALEPLPVLLPGAAGGAGGDPRHRPRPSLEGPPPQAAGPGPARERAAEAVVRVSQPLRAAPPLPGDVRGRPRQRSAPVRRDRVRLPEAGPGEVPGRASPAPPAGEPGSSRPRSR